jgi:hypothetical protein
LPAKNPRFPLNLQNPDTKEEMERLAQEHFRTVSAEIEAACWAWIKQHKDAPDQ